MIQASALRALVQQLAKRAACLGSVSNRSPCLSETRPRNDDGLSRRAGLHAVLRLGGSLPLAPSLRTNGVFRHLCNSSRSERLASQRAVLACASSSRLSAGGRVGER